MKRSADRVFRVDGGRRLHLDAFGRNSAGLAQLGDDGLGARLGQPGQVRLADRLGLRPPRKHGLCQLPRVPGFTLSCGGSALLVHFSTDYVFDGRKPAAYTETDVSNPLGVCGATKLAGEQAVQHAGAPHLILRTSWVYGLRGRNFLLTMQRLAREGDTLGVVDDQFGAPTWSRLIAEATALVVARWLDRPDRHAVSGIYHLTCAGRTSWHGFTSSILAHLAPTDTKLAKLNAIPTSAYPTQATRPSHSQLDCDKLAATFWRHVVS